MLLDAPPAQFGGTDLCWSDAVTGVRSSCDEQLAGPIQGVVLAAAVCEGLLSDSAADLDEGVVAQPHDGEGVRDLRRVRQSFVER